MVDLESCIRTFFEKNYQDVPNTDSICEIIKRTGSDNLTLFFSTNENAENVDKDFDLKEYYKLYKDCAAAKKETHDIYALLLNQNIIYHLIWESNKDKTNELEKLISINNLKSILKTEIDSAQKLAVIELYAGNLCNDSKKRIAYNLKSIQHLLKLSQINEEYKEFFIPHLGYFGHSFYEIGKNIISLMNKGHSLKSLQEIDGINELYSTFRLKNERYGFRSQLKTENAYYLKNLKNIFNIENQPVENLTRKEKYKFGLDCLRIAANFFIQESERNQLHNYQQLFNICCELDSFKNQDEDLKELAKRYQEKILDKIFRHFSKQYLSKQYVNPERELEELLRKYAGFLNLKKGLILLKNEGINNLIEKLNDPHQIYLLRYIENKIKEYLKDNKTNINKDNVLVGIEEAVGINFEKVEPLLFAKTKNQFSELEESHSSMIEIYLFMADITKNESYVDKAIELNNKFFEVKNEDETKSCLNQKIKYYLYQSRIYACKSRLRNNELESIIKACESLRLIGSSDADIFVTIERNYLKSIVLLPRLEKFISGLHFLYSLTIEDKKREYATQIYRLSESEILAKIDYGLKQDKKMELLTQLKAKIKKDIKEKKEFKIIGKKGKIIIYSHD